MTPDRQHVTNTASPVRAKASLRAGDDLGDVLQSALTRTRGRQAVTFTVAIAVLLAVAALMVWRAQQYVLGNAWVTHTMQVLLASEIVHSRSRTVESDARAYRLTDRQALLSEYAANKALLDGDIRHLKRLLREDAEPLAIAERIEVLAAKRLEHLDALIALQLAEGAIAARESELNTNASGHALMRELETELEHLSAEQQDRLDARQLETARHTGWLITLIIIGMLLPIGMLLLLRRGLVQEANHSDTMEKAATLQSRQLQVSLENLNLLSEHRRILNTYTGMLQSCQDLDEALHSTRAVLHQLIPGAHGGLYRMRASQNLLERVGDLSEEADDSEPLFSPGQCWALRRGQPYHVQEGSALPLCPHMGEAVLHVGDSDSLCIPLTAQGQMLGLLQIRLNTGQDDESWRINASTVAEQLSLCIANLELRETLRQQSLRDQLTGLYNRRYLEENLRRELSRCLRRGLPFSVIMLDVDHFKRFNDQHGHAAGDALLAAVGQVLLQSTRTDDIACRYGGEEFLLALPETSHEDALLRAEQIRQRIANTTVQHMHVTYGPATASLGVASAPPLGYDQDALQQSADQALYRAKHGGRNRVQSAHATEQA